MNEQAPSELNQLQDQLRQFAVDRDWQQFHNAKNLVLALVGETGELAAVFQWLTPEQAATIMHDPAARQHVEHELADVFAYLLRLADVLDINLATALQAKIALNAMRYPVERARGNSLKYTQMQEDQ